MKLEMPTPTPAAKAPKSRWDTHPEPTLEEAAQQDLREAESEFDNAWYPFSDQERALLKREEDGWDWQSGLFESSFEHLRGVGANKRPAR
jgi:hypothetical protein